MDATAYKTGLILRNKRREMGLSQKVMADRIGCTPSALCMFEKGKSDALSVERLNKACEVLGLKGGELLDAGRSKYCPNVDCPSHRPYRVGAEIQLLPEAFSPESAPHCAWCGEVLENTCVHCGRAYEPGTGFCGECGQAYIDSALVLEPEPALLERLLTLQQEWNNFKKICNPAGETKVEPRRVDE